MRKPSFALRNIRNGRVRILGHEYAADTPLPDHLNGLRAAFSLYWGPPSGYRYDERGLMTAVSLWGSAQMYAAANDEEADFESAYDANPFCENGVYKWEWWSRVPEPESER